MIDTTKGFTLTRELDATPDAIWSAWTDPDQVADWWHGRGGSTPRESVHLDVRVGGEYSYTMVDGISGEAVVTAGVYREIAPGERLVFSWGLPDAPDDDRPVVTVTITPLGELTRLGVELRGVDGVAGDGFYYDGWASVLDELVQHLGQMEVFG